MQEAMEYNNEEKQQGEDFEIQFYEGVLKNNPDFVDALVILGDLYTKRGWYEKGLAVDKHLLHLRPQDPDVLYNLACSYSLLNNIDQAFNIMKMAVESGYGNFDYLKQDPDLANLREHQHFQDYLSKRQKSRDV